MGTLHLTKRLIDQSKYEGIDGAAFVLWDDALPGFGLRVYPTGKKSFMLKYRFEGRQRNLVLGQYGALTLEQARAAAKEALHEVSQGKDPLGVRQAKIEAPTMEALINEYLESHAKVHKRSFRNDERQLRSHIPSTWGKRKVASITRADISKLHRRLGEDNGHYEANRTVATLSKMFELAKRWGYLDERLPNPAHGVEKFKEEKRHHAIDLADMPRLAKAIDANPSTYIRAALWLLLFLGCRKGELLSARWEQVDFEKRLITFPRTKAGRPFVAPLSGPALAMLEALPREEGNPYIIPGRVNGHPLVNLTKPWRQILKDAGLPKDIRLHDLRHTFGTSLSNAGVSLTIVGAALNHSQPSVTARYAQPAPDPVRQAVEAHAERLVAAAKGQEAEVIPLNKTAGE